jgi:hypothetical protein
MKTFSHYPAAFHPALHQATLEAPLHSLALAFVIGVLVARCDDAPALVRWWRVLRE